MSSIMDELRKLQGGRTPSPPPPTLSGPPPTRPSFRLNPVYAVGFLAVVLAGLVAMLVLPTLGRSRARAPAQTVSQPRIITARAEERSDPPAGTPAPGVASARTQPEQVVSTPDMPEDADSTSGEQPDETASCTDPIEASPESALTLGAVADRGPEPKTDRALEQADPTAVEPERPASAQNAEENVPATTGPAEKALAAGTLADTVTEPDRVLTEAEDEANRTAIRALTVQAVFGDDNSVVVYTSAGQLRQGTRFKDMDVMEVTTRSVLFQCGKKRYRWCLPSRLSGGSSGNTEKAPDTRTNGSGTSG
ncbi:MAG: hypothetical protein JW889_00335 [Verrucomicrobia bacterium]|nr:hypothetical protein [Verrucomicrobiota bacterium]